VKICLLVVPSLVSGLLWSQIGNISVTNAASFRPGIPPGGSIGTIFCTGINVKGTVSAPKVPLPTTLAGVTVTVNGTPAPLFAVADLGSYQQINFQVAGVSDGLPPNRFASSQIVISQNGIQGSANIAPGTSWPGDFFRLSGGTFGVFQHGADYSLVTIENPAAAGETIIGYATGLPTASPYVAPGEAAPSVPLSSLPTPSVNLLGHSIDQIGLSINYNIWLPYSYSIGQSPVPFMGLAPGAVGVYQINFVVPNGIPSGTATIVIGDLYCIEMFSVCGKPGSWTHYTGAPVLLPVR
jgi:uncharacterized protein (TIGR03437 family)